MIGSKNDKSSIKYKKKKYEYITQMKNFYNIKYNHLIIGKKGKFH